MKNNIIAFVLLFVAFVSTAQTVNCDLTYETTIQGFDVYTHNPSGAIVFRAKMYIDADGSPRAYGPNNSGLDWTANAGSPGNWWGIVTDGNGDPVIQGAGDPYPGMYVSTTSLVNSSYGTTNPLRYVNSETVPFFVLPSAVVSIGAIHIGDIGYVYNTSTGLGCYAIYADAGPSGSLGEGSMYLADQIGVNSNPRTGGTSSGIIDYIVFPQSGYGQGTIPTITQINSLGTTNINTVGGIGIAGCLDNPINNPANLQATPSACPNNTDVTFTWTNTGSNWHIDISTSPTFTNYWLKYVSNSITYTGPVGFVDHVDGITPLNLQAGTTYYWRIVNSNGSFNGSSFTVLTCDNVVPTTSISTPGNWKTADFIATFTDNDNVGVEKSFYQVLDFDGTYWGANASNGFFADNFDIQQSFWTSGLGIWNVTGNELVQTDETQSNSNFYTPLNQNLSNRYLYQFTAKVEGTGTNRRFGFHLFCDDASQTNRGNSYFVWFRVEDQTLEFYKVTANAFTTASQIISNVVTTPGQYYDFKITYDRILGIIAVWRDNIFMGSWTDPTPYSTNGNYISFRSGNSKLTVSDIKVFRSRNQTTTVTLNGSTKDIRYQNPNPTTFGAKIKSIVVDASNNLSTIAFHDLNIDWTPPTDVTVSDGTSLDIDTVYSTTTASSVWTASADPNSDIAEYWYTLGSTSGGTDIVSWTNNGTNTSVTLNGLSLIVGNHYYFSVKSMNNAGLWSNVISSDGFIVLNPSSVYSISSDGIKVMPNPFKNSLRIEFGQNINGAIQISDAIGNSVYNCILNSVNYIEWNTNQLKLKSGMYFIVITDNSGKTYKTAVTKNE